MYKLLLDDKNKKVLTKKLYNQPMTVKEKKRLHRTKKIIQDANNEVKFNQRYENKINELFF